MNCCGRTTNKLPRAEDAPAIRLSRYGAGLNDDFSYPPAPPGFIRLTQWRPGSGALPDFHLAQAGDAAAAIGRAGAVRLFRSIGGLRAAARRNCGLCVAIARGAMYSRTSDHRQRVGARHRSLRAAVAGTRRRGGHRESRISWRAPHLRRLWRAASARADRRERNRDWRPWQRKRRLVYVTPSHQFPTGVAMSLTRRLELIEWSRRHNAVLIEDDYDSEYRYSGPPLPSLQGLATGVAVIYIGTFSKVMFPSLRIGYVIAPREPGRRGCGARSGWPTGRPRFPSKPRLRILFPKVIWSATSAACAESTESGGMHLVESLERHFGDRVQIRGDAAGMHVLVRFQTRRSPRRPCAAKVQLVSSASCYLDEPPRGEFILGLLLDWRAIDPRRNPAAGRSYSITGIG